MKLSELIAAIGDDNVKFQNLDSVAAELDWRAGTGTKVVFYTDVGIHPATGLDKLGLVVWLPRDAVTKAIADEKK